MKLARMAGVAAPSPTAAANATVTSRNNSRASFLYRVTAGTLYLNTRPDARGLQAYRMYRLTALEQICCPRVPGIQTCISTGFGVAGKEAGTVIFT